MNLEAAIAANTAAVQALTAAMLGTGTAAIPASVVAAVKPADAPAAPAAASAPAAAANTPPTFEEVKVPFLALSRSHGREVVTVLLGKYGITLLSGAKPEQFGAILADIKAAAALPAPAKAA